MFTLNCKGKLLMIDKPIVMGVINSTPDSFYTNSRQHTAEQALQKATQMLQEGATIIDIGGQTTKPNVAPITQDEELKRVIPVIEIIIKNFPDTLISIDTYYASVAKEAVQAGACIVNDISAGLLDNAMLQTIAQLKTPYVCMHMQGTPQTMQQNPQYENVTKEVVEFFIERIEACRLAGVYDVIIDVGFGFGKTIQHNMQLLKGLEVFKILEKPILLGVSRKSTIYKIIETTAEEALNGTTVLNTIGLLNGANILRVHDVKEAVECIKLIDVYRQ
ncbi:MAG: dihydropteroate synthase [Chitinophagaceae bacterium]|nr:dihydropteroate synthase [Chitinophagaceae bacterium]MCW5904689.1 dihydropteroate synthase [Chitinophagaceae bacterium]